VGQPFPGGGEASLLIGQCASGGAGPAAAMRTRSTPMRTRPIPTLTRSTPKPNRPMPTRIRPTLMWTEQVQTVRYERLRRLGSLVLRLGAQIMRYTLAPARPRDFGIILVVMLPATSCGGRIKSILHLRFLLPSSHQIRFQALASVTVAVPISGLENRVTDHVYPPSA
jgi:hypothetical protein